jgi:hypothetical protein
MISVGLASSPAMIPSGWISWQATLRSHFIVWLEVATSFIATSELFTPYLVILNKTSG